MEQIYVQRWASSLRQFHPSTGSDVDRIKIKENEAPCDNHKYSFTLDFTSPKSRVLKSQFSTFDMTTTKTDDNQPEIDPLSDTDTYTIDDPSDNPKSTVPSSFKRCHLNQTKTRHGTFDLHGLISSASHTITRPIVDSNLSTRDPSPLPYDHDLRHSSVSHNTEFPRNVSDSKRFAIAKSFLSSQMVASKSATNRAVELRRARAQAKIEELRKQSQKFEHSNDSMSTSWHSNASSQQRQTTATSLRSKVNPYTARSSSASPNSRGQGMTVDCLREDGQTLAIHLIQLSSGILQKLKSDRHLTSQLERLVQQLQTVNQTLTRIDASFK